MNNKWDLGIISPARVWGAQPHYKSSRRDTAISEFYGARGRGEGAECRLGGFEIQYLGVVIRCGIHRLQLRILCEHVLLCLETVIADQLARYAQPDAVLERADLCLRVRLNLLRDCLDLAGLDIKPNGRTRG